MSCQPSLSKSATQTPGPNSSRLIEMPLFPLKCLNLMPAAAVTFVNSMCGFCAGSFERKMEHAAANESNTIPGLIRGLQLLVECWGMVSVDDRGVLLLRILHGW